jgi:anthranilate synthase component 2
VSHCVVIDNYDSFTFNLVQYLQEIRTEVTVVRNDALSAEEAHALAQDFVLLSPGPSDPDRAGICLELIRLCAAARKPLLGVCLGHQAIGQAFGGKVVRAPLPVHGKTSKVTHHGTRLFAGLPSPLRVTRYHSLVVEKSSLPEGLNVTAESEDGLVMALEHKHLPIAGVQFHPESVLTEHGKEMLANFIATYVPQKKA